MTDPNLTTVGPIAAETAVATLMRHLGVEPEGDLEATPGRVVRALWEMTRGYRQDPYVILSRVFDVQCDELVLLRGVRFTSLCEHHVLPFVGVAHVGYVPSKVVVGLSKLARVVEAFACRLQVQERMTREIANAIDTVLAPKGVAVVVEASHSCLGCRGAKQPDAVMVTSAMLGCFRSDQAARSEFLQLVRSA